MFNDPYTQTVIPQFQNQFANMLNPNSQKQSIHVVKVNGRAGAESFSMPADSDVLLLDQNNPIVWFIQTDGAGYKTVTPYTITPYKEVTPDDKYNSLEQRIKKLEEAVSNVKSYTGPNYKNQSKSGDKHNDAGVRSNA